MTRLDELAARAGAAIQEDARRRSAQAPAIAQVHRRRVRRRAGLAGGVAALTVGAVVFTGSWLAGAPQLRIDDPIGAPADPTPSPGRPSTPETDPEQLPRSGDIAGPVALLPGGWAPAQLPIETAGRTVVVASSGPLPAFVVAGGTSDADLVVGADDGWVVHEGVVRRPDVLATTSDGGGWVLALATGSASLFTAEGTAAPVDPTPADLDGGLTGAAWRDDGFVVVGRATGPDEPTPVFLVDPRTGGWETLPDAPLAVNRDWNSAVVATGGHVYLVGTWLDGANAPARPTLAAARLDTDDTWTLLDAGVLSPRSADAVAVDGRVLAVDYNGDAAWLDDDGWSGTVPTGIPASECGSELAANARHVLATGCEAAVFDRPTRTWTRIAPPTPREEHTLGRAVPTPEGFLVPTVRPTISGATANDLLALEPTNAWPLEPGMKGVIARPAGWTIATEPLVDEVADPELVTLSTAPMPTGGPAHCDGLPTAALDRLGPSDALVSVRTSGDAASDAPEVGTLTDLEAAGDEQVPVGCTSSDIIVHRFQVRAGPEGLEVIVAHGRDAPDTLRHTARAIANSYSSR